MIMIDFTKCFLFYDDVHFFHAKSSVYQSIYVLTKKEQKLMKGKGRIKKALNSILNKFTSDKKIF